LVLQARHFSDIGVIGIALYRDFLADRQLHTYTVRPGLLLACVPLPLFASGTQAANASPMKVKGCS
jgi:hypothetical protein